MANAMNPSAHGQVSRVPAEKAPLRAPRWGSLGKSACAPRLATTVASCTLTSARVGAPPARAKSAATAASQPPCTVAVGWLQATGGRSG